MIIIPIKQKNQNSQKKSWKTKKSSYNIDVSNNGNTIWIWKRERRLSFFNTKNRNNLLFLNKTTI